MELDEERVRKMKDEIVAAELKKQAARAKVKSDKHWKIKLVFWVDSAVVGAIWLAFTLANL